MSIEVGNLVSRKTWRYPGYVNDICVVNSVSPSAIKFYDIETVFNEMYDEAKEDFRQNGCLTEDEDGNEIYIKFDEEDENEPSCLARIVSRIMGCPHPDDWEEFRNTGKWDFIDCDLTEHFSRPIWKHLEFKMVHTQLIKMTNLKTLEKLSVQYFKDEDGKSYFIREDEGYNSPEWSGEFIDYETAVFLTNDSCWEVATTVCSMHEDHETDFQIL